MATAYAREVLKSLADYCREQSAAFAERANYYDSHDPGYLAGNLRAEAAAFEQRASVLGDLVAGDWSASIGLRITEGPGRDALDTVLAKGDV